MENTPEKASITSTPKKKITTKATVMTKLTNFAPCRSSLGSDALPPHSRDLSWFRLGQNLLCCQGFKIGVQTFSVD